MAVLTQTNLLLLLVLFLLVRLTLWYLRRLAAGRRRVDVLQMGESRRKTRDAEVSKILEKYKDRFPTKNRMDIIIKKYQSLASLRKAMDEGELSSQELVLTYVHRAATEGMKLNALADIMFEDAIKQAEIMDSELKGGKVRGFLHGIPVSFKDQIIIKNSVCTLGVCSMSDQMFNDDGLVAETIRKHGGIPFTKSNLPQLHFFMFKISYNLFY